VERDRGVVGYKSWDCGVAGSCIFPTESCQFPTEDITGAQNFNLAPEFHKMGIFDTGTQMLYFAKI